MSKLPESMKNSAGAWMVLDLRRDSETLEGLARTYAMYASKFPALFNASIAYDLQALAKKLRERGETLENLLAQLPGPIPDEYVNH